MRVTADGHADAETQRLQEDARREKNWKRWGPYLSERQWGTVREDYSENGDAWDYFPHDHARSRVYRWGEDGLLGLCDREGRLCLALALWNGKDPILKERLFGLTNGQGNHGEDVKECYYYLDATPTASYLKALFKYPQAEFPYDELVRENARRTRLDPEYELLDTGVFDGDRYFDVFAEYAKASPDDVLARITVANRGPEPARLHLLPTLWYRNTWSWGRQGDGYFPRPSLRQVAEGKVLCEHASLGRFHFLVGPGPDGRVPPLLFTENETNNARLFKARNTSAHVKDAFHEYVVHGRAEAVNPAGAGTKVAAHYVLDLPPGGTASVELRLFAEDEVPDRPFGEDFDRVFAERLREADAFHRRYTARTASEDDARIDRQAHAGLVWSKQFYHYIVKDWLEGDPAQVPPPASRKEGRNSDWELLFNRDVISMPDNWEYPWFAAWDLAFHMVAFAHTDPFYAKDQLILFLREWYMHPSGRVPAYEWNFDDVNPPVHAWACWRVYKMTGPRGGRDRLFLERAFQKLLLTFTWWVNRKDVHGKNLFSGGFLGLDNISLFDRSQPLPGGATLEQADGTAWMAFYCVTMLAMALELARHDPAYEDIASKFFEHFVAIADAMNTLGGSGLWDEQDGFYYDQMHADGSTVRLRIRSMVGLIPLFAVEILDDRVLDHLPGFRKRMLWFLNNRRDLARNIAYLEPGRDGEVGRRLLAIPSRPRLERVLRYLLDEGEFLSPHGIRSLSRYHKDHPYVCRLAGEEQRVDYVAGESVTGLYGGNSNWRGPVWFPVNYLLVEALERYHHFYGDSLKVECPVGSGKYLTLGEVSRELATRLVSLFRRDAQGLRPCLGPDRRFADNLHWRDLLLFHEYFHGDNGLGLGANHQTGWTALVSRLMEDCLRCEEERGAHEAAGGPSAFNK
jgi:hypothetical protein